MKFFCALLFVSSFCVQSATSEPLLDKTSFPKSHFPLHKITLSSQDREILARVSYAEAATQGEAGLAGVVYTILNRYASGRFGKTIEQVVNAPHQFEPVHRAGGWHNLPLLTKEQQAKIDTIISLALTGYLPDMTQGALFFQNPKIVASRERQGKVSTGLTHFGGQTPTVVIKDHAFYQEIKSSKKPHIQGTLSKSAHSPLQQTASKMLAYDVFAEQTTSTIFLFSQ